MELLQNTNNNSIELHKAGVLCYTISLKDHQAKPSPATSALPMPHVDLIMQEVASWRAVWETDSPKETPEGLRGMWNDLRMRLQTLTP